MTPKIIKVILLVLFGALDALCFEHVLGWLGGLSKVSQIKIRAAS